MNPMISWLYRHLYTDQYVPKETSMTSISDDALIYHLYPLGTCGAPWTNPGGEPVPRIRSLTDWIEPAQRIGANTLLLGPLWESGTHGYDTFDYTVPDRRLGTRQDVQDVLNSWKVAGFRIVLDGVFNHCGRAFAPFADLMARGAASPYADWFAGVRFDQRNALGDPFTYDTWNGHAHLVKFNLANPDLRAYLFTAVAEWMDDYGIDGLRLDAADVMDRGFQRELANFCRNRKPGFWLMGEVIHGDYNEWTQGAQLDSVTNYELFKGLWSSHNDANYHEVAWTLNRQFGPQGIYRGQQFATFGDNHDVNRIASTLTNPAHLYPHAILTATVPGLPTVYYGSEAGLPGTKSATDDEALRPSLTADDLDRLPHQSLRDLWGRLAHFRRLLPALKNGHYRQATVAPQQFAFWRETEESTPAVLVVVNSDSQSSHLRIETPPNAMGECWLDLLNPNETFDAKNGFLDVPLWPHWGRILVAEVAGRAIL